MSRHDFRLTSQTHPSDLFWLIWQERTDDWTALSVVPLINFWQALVDRISGTIASLRQLWSRQNYKHCHPLPINQTFIAIVCFVQYRWKQKQTACKQSPETKKKTKWVKDPFTFLKQVKQKNGKMNSWSNVHYFGQNWPRSPSFPWQTLCFTAMAVSVHSIDDRQTVVDYRWGALSLEPPLICLRQQR